MKIRMVSPRGHWRRGGSCFVAFIAFMGFIGADMVATIRKERLATKDYNCHNCSCIQAKMDEMHDMVDDFMAMIWFEVVAVLSCCWCFVLCCVCV